MTSRKNTKQRGMTLVEVITYSALLIIITSAVVGIVLNFASVYESIHASNKLRTSAVSAADRIVFEIRNAQDITSVSSNDITLTNISGDTIDFALTSGKITIEENGGGTQNLTGSDVTATTLNFEHLGSSGSSNQAVTVVFTLETPYKDTVKQTSFQDTIVLRGAY
ncbi:MAG: hypothetical protein KAR24_00310 [Candidatus Pacebacteria bacterium]|nr:hypothetical protein [Candidatus Paceibacterota bacterium]